MKAIKRLIRGARYSEKYGNHPGTGIVIAFLVTSALSGFIGFLIMAAFVVPAWLVGCWNRGD